MPGEITIKPLSELLSYNHTFYLASDMELVQSRAFFSRIPNHRPYGLSGDRQPPEGFKSGHYPSLKRFDGLLLEQLDMDPRSHYRIDGWRDIDRNLVLPQITEEGIQRFVNLAERLGAKVVVTTDMDTLYCSPNTLKQPEG